MLDISDVLPDTPALVRFDAGKTTLGLWRGGVLHDLTASSDSRLHSLEQLLTLTVSEIRSLLDDPALASLPTVNSEEVNLLAPVDSQEVWAAGVTYLRSREARMEEAASKDIYALVYEADRPELFFKAAGWRVVPPGGEVGIRPDSTWDVPEPELAVLSNAHGEIIAYSCGNDMSSRSIEGENPLYLPQAKVYDAGASIGPAAVLAWNVEPRQSTISMTIERDGKTVFTGQVSIGAMVRELPDLVGALYAVYPLPVGAWLLTGTGIVPPLPYTAEPGDEVVIRISGIGELRNRVRRVGAPSPPPTGPHMGK